MWSLLENSEGPRVFIYAREDVAGVGKYGPFSYFIFLNIYIYIFWVGGGGAWKLQLVIYKWIIWKRFADTIRGEFWPFGVLN